ncbi:type II secretion system protein J [Desulfosporosinus sp. BICA1-9]|uniref:PulJ/GspJ family protein n=1 Tax=Desulfosporosinus sp. BICA1-9 TaxID=1531958 RepID=UPI000B27380A|nr:prepilin-type cleavage/methylation domain-containing protein [Desulfosporosinus sp. BICA1-9]
MLLNSRNANRNRNRNSSTAGLTLMEVLFALLITGIFLIIALRFLTDQWRGARSLKNHLEAHYFVMTAGTTVSDVIRTAQTVEWVPDPGVLKVLPLPDDVNLAPSLDIYFVGDLDHDETRDLYWRHLGASQPVASYVTGWECREVEPGLWEIFLQASVEEQTVIWQSMIRQRAHSTISHGSRPTSGVAFTTLNAEPPLVAVNTAITSITSITPITPITT